MSTKRRYFEGEKNPSNDLSMIFIDMPETVLTDDDGWPVSKRDDNNSVRIDELLREAGSLVDTVEYSDPLLRTGNLQNAKLLIIEILRANRLSMIFKDIYESKEEVEVFSVIVELIRNGMIEPRELKAFLMQADGFYFEEAIDPSSRSARSLEYADILTILLEYSLRNIDKIDQEILLVLKNASISFINELPFKIRYLQQFYPHLLNPRKYLIHWFTILEIRILAKDMEDMLSTRKDE